MKTLSILKTLVCLSIVFLFPLFFLPFTQEFFASGKLYLLAFGALLLLTLSTLQLLTAKKLAWQTHPFDGPIVLFLITIALSTVISSPNKIQALLNPNLGLVSIFSLTVLYFYLSRAEIIGGALGRAEQNLLSLQVSSFILSLITIIFFFQPLKNTNLPLSLQFLKNPQFTPIGNQLDLAIFLGFFVISQLSQFLTIHQFKSLTVKKKVFNFSFLIFTLVALSLTLYSLLKPGLNREPQTASLLLPPFRLSWYAAVETLKNLPTALFGVGIDNFASIFTRVKDLAYNQSNLWQINSFSLSRSTLLHIFTETGFFGFLAFSLLFFNLINLARKQFSNLTLKILIFYILFFILFFPPSLPLFFLFFILLAAAADGFTPSTDLPKSQQVAASFHLSSLLPIYLGINIISLIFILGAGYLLGRSYAAEVSFKKALDGFAKNDARQVYDNMRQAIILNPYIERFRINFSQTNLLLANNISSKKPKEITDQDRQNISQGIQAAIAEGKAAVTLNPQKAENWENLAIIYRNILNVAQGADVWTISAYQRAIISDPQNPIYRLNLGGTYYSLGSYEEAVRWFEQSVGLKPDWSNAHYNLAWALYQRKDYQRAAAEMQNVSQLVDPKSEDFKKVQKDLEEFKKMLPEEEATAAGELKPGQLSLPTPPTATFEPKIELPKEASPEAQ